MNGQLLVDDWHYHGTIENSGTITLAAGKKYSIKLEYFQGCCGDAISLWWSWPGQTKQIIPQNRLFVPPGGSYVTNTLNQYTKVGVRAVGYDGNFNITSFDGGNFVYNAQSQLVSGTKGTNTVQFLYDGLGRCLKRTTNGASVIFAYDGWKPIAEWAGDGSYWGFRIYGSGQDEVLWHYDSRYGYFRVHSDVHGNVMALLGWGGGGVEKYTVDAFGKPKITDWGGNVRSQSAVANRFMYTGREWIAELGIYDYRNRMYLPELGRFLQTDPKGFDAGDMNLFRYCGDDPVDRSDPMGLYYEKIDNGHDSYTIRIPITYSGKTATDDVVAKYETGIRSLSGGYKVDGRAVTVAFEPTRVDHGSTKPANRVTVEAGEGVKQFGQEHGSDSAIWREKGASNLFGYRISPEDGARHSVGHFLRWKDGYNKNTGETYAGYMGNVMDFRPGGAVSEAQIRQLIKPGLVQRVGNAIGYLADRSGSNLSSHNSSTGLSARYIDMTHQSTGVPSLGAESVNFAPGKP